MHGSVSIVVLNWNGFSDTAACLSSLEHLDYPNYRVMVVDNGSTDDSAARIRKDFPSVELIETGKNLGFAGGCNVGIRQAIREGAEFIWLLNNDTTVDPGALKALVDGAQTEPRIGAVGSAIYYMHDRERLQCWGGGYVNFWLGRSRHIFKQKDEGKLQFVTGASLLLTRAAIDEVGELDEGFFMYWEDADYCFRIRAAGAKLAVAGSSKIWHKESSSVGKGSSRMDSYFSASAARFFRKHAAFPSLPLWTGVTLSFAKRAFTGDWERLGTLWMAVADSKGVRRIAK